jgi:hypothetical protein
MPKSKKDRIRLQIEMDRRNPATVVVIAFITITN